MLIIQSEDFFAGSQFNDPSIVKTGPASWVMFATSSPESQPFQSPILPFRFTSPDKVTWTLDPAGAVITEDGTPYVSIETPTVVIHNGTWHLYYTGMLAGGGSAIGHATSADGITWAHQSTDIIPVPAGWTKVAEPAALVVGDEIHLFYTLTGARQVIARSISSDGDSFADWEIVLEPLPKYLVSIGYTGYASPAAYNDGGNIYLFFSVAYDPGGAWRQVFVSCARQLLGESAFTQRVQPLLRLESYSFVNDEVRAPSAIIEGGNLDLWFAGTSGATLAIGYEQRLDFVDDFLPPAVPANYADLDLATEVDTEAHIVVDGAIVNVTGLTSNETAGVFEDFGAGHFGSFTHYGKITTHSAAVNSNGAFHALTNAIGPVPATNQQLFLNYSSGQLALIELYNNGASYNIDAMAVAPDTDLWYKFTRSKPAAKAQVTFYSDPAWSVEVDTLSIDLMNNEDYQFRFAVQSWSVAEPAAISFDVANLSINSPANQAPTIEIDSPIDGGIFTTAQQVAFLATAADNDDGDLSATVEWVSDIDGLLGTGNTSVTLSAGVHTITATATDNGGLQTVAEITLGIVQPVPLTTNAIALVYAS